MKKVYIQPVVDTNDFATVSMLCGSPTVLGPGNPFEDYETVTGD